MILRRLERKDAPGMLEWMHDESIYSLFRVDFANMSINDVNSFIEHSYSKENQHFAYVDDKDEYMGTISLKNIDYSAREAEYAIVFRRVSHGKGYAKDATRQLLRYAFEQLDLNRVYLNVYDTNLHAIEFYEKNGFVEFAPPSRILNNNDTEHLLWYVVERDIWTDDLVN